MKVRENYLALALIIIGVTARFLPHVPNFVPITAIAIFSGRYFKKPWSYLVPFSVMLVSDIFLGFSQITIFVYLGLLIAIVLGSWLRQNSGWRNTALAALISSVAFFVISNFGVWVGGWYSYSWLGLVKCFTMAIPFFRYSLAGDLFYTVVMFGAYEILRRQAFIRSEKLA